MAATTITTKVYFDVSTPATVPALILSTTHIINYVVRNVAHTAQTFNLVQLVSVVIQVNLKGSLLTVSHQSLKCAERGVTLFSLQIMKHAYRLCKVW
jgi:hypothetical protein